MSLTISWSLPKFMSIASMMSYNHVILCHPLLLLPSIFPRIRVFSNELAVHIRWPKNWSFSFNISPSNEYLWLISYKIDWFDLFALESRGLSIVFSSTTVQKHQFFSTLPSLSSVQLLHVYMTTGKSIALTIQTSVGQVMCFCF